MCGPRPRSARSDQAAGQTVTGQRRRGALSGVSIDCVAHSTTATTTGSYVLHSLRRSHRQARIIQLWWQLKGERALAKLLPCKGRILEQEIPTAQRTVGDGKVAPDVTQVIIDKLALSSVCELRPVGVLANLTDGVRLTIFEHHL